MWLKKINIHGQSKDNYISLNNLNNNNNNIVNSNSSYKMSLKIENYNKDPHNQTKIQNRTKFY